MGASLLAKAASQPTNPHLNAHTPTVGAGLPTMAASQPTNPQLNALSQMVGAGLPAMAASQPTNLPPECTHSNCGSEPARESGLSDKNKTTEQTPQINIIPQPRLKYTNRYAIMATTPCAVTYGYARIRRLTRLCVELIVSLSLKSVIGFGSPFHYSRAPHYRSVFGTLLFGGHAWGSFGSAGFTVLTGLPTHKWPPPFVW